MNKDLIDLFSPLIYSQNREKIKQKLSHNKPSSPFKKRFGKIAKLKLMSSGNTSIATSNHKYQYQPQTKLQFLYQKLIDFSKEMTITQEEYEAAIQESNIIAQSITAEYINEICHLTTLTSHQRHLLEFLSYIIGYEFFDWNYLRKQLLFNMKNKLMLVAYDRLSLFKINQLLNRLSVEGRFPRFILPYSIDYLYKWVKSQITIIIYQFQHRELGNRDETNQETPKVEPLIEAPVNNTEIRTIMSPYTIKTLCPIGLMNQKTMRNDMIQSGGGVSSLSIPLIPRTKQKNTNSHLNKKKDITCVLNEQSIELNGYDYLREKFLKENDAIQFLPLLHNRSINQMSQIYCTNSDPYYKRNKKLKLSDDLKNSSLINSMNKEKLIKMLSHNKSIALNSLSSEKLLELISE